MASSTRSTSWEVSRRVLSNISAYIDQNYCRVYVPNYQYLGEGLSYTTLYFREKSDCANMIKGLRDYYAGNFNEICTLSYKASGIVRMVARWDGYEILSSCGTYSAADFTRKKRDELHPTDILVALLLSAPTYLALELLGGGKEG